MKKAEYEGMHLEIKKLKLKIGRMIYTPVI